MALNPPVLNSPSNAATVIGNALVFTFTIPTDSNNSKLVFRVELDTINPPNYSDTNYIVYESRFSDGGKNGTWQYQDSGIWYTMPSGGLGSSYYGKTAKITVLKQNVVKYPSINTVWYWDIGASDNMGLNPVFNEVIFAQAIFA